MANLKDLIVNGSARILGNLYATLKGNADTATKLETARTIRTNLGSTSAVGFDGTANITPGIQGTLSVANGGTGQTSIANIQAGKDADGNVISETYAKISDQGNLLPNFDSMTPVQTIEFDTADSNYHQICTRTNTETDQADLNDVIYFRITVTGTSIHQVGNFAVVFPGRQNNQPYVIANMFPGTTSSTYGGVRYLRYIFPKALNNGYGWALEVINNRNTTARHYKVEVFKTNPKITWVTGTASTYNSTYQSSGSIDIETRYGYNFNYMYGTITQADNASQVNNRLSKFINSTLNTAGAALVANSFVYQNGNQIYPASDKTKAIEVGFGIQWITSAYSSGNGVGWDQIRQKLSVTTLTNIPHATLVRGNPCYFRCTMDSNGNILSDNYVDVSMANGYTWYYIGVAQSATAIAIDTSQSFFLTLDSNGKLTHINGKEVGGSGGTVDQTYDATSANAQSGVAINGAKFLQNKSTRDGSYIIGNNNTSDRNGGTIIIGENITGASLVDVGSIKIGNRINTDGYKYGSGVYIGNGIKSAAGGIIITGYNTRTSSTTVGNTSGKIGGIILCAGPSQIGPDKGASSVLIAGNNLGSSQINADHTTFISANYDRNDVITEDNTFWWANNIGLYKIIDSDGKIPDDRLNTTIVRTSDTEVVHVVIESYVNGTEWYRVYDDGWVEQGGMVSVPKSGVNVELLREMTDTNYSILLGGSGTSASQDGNNIYWYSKTITSISLANKQYGTDNQTRDGYWYVCGYGAEVFYI